MSKRSSSASIAVTALFNIAVLVAPGIKAEYRPPLFVLALVLLVLACLWWWIAHRTESMHESASGGISVSAKDANDLLTSAGSSTAARISTGSGAINAPVAGRDIIYHAPTVDRQIWPYIYPQLIIDNLEIEPGHILLHFDIKNGDIPIENILTHVSSKRNNAKEYGRETHRNSMAPNAELSTLGNCVQRTNDDNDVIRLAVYYSARVDSIVKNFISEHIFHISRDKLTPGTMVKPSKNHYDEGDVPNYDDPNSIRENWTSKLAQKTGWIAFTPPELSSTGAPNVMLIQFENKLFLFDGANRVVSFKIRAPSGRIVDLQQALPITASGYHIVCFGWRETGGWLRVDDQDEVRRYDE